MKKQTSEVKKLFEEDGFSLVGVVIAAAALSFLMLGAAQMITNQSKNVYYLEDKL